MHNDTDLSRTRIDSKRRDRGATDPILVIAAIAVSLVLLVGGSFAVSGIVSNGQNLNARSDLDKVATAQAGAKGALDTYFVYDSHADSQYRALEDANVTGGIGFTPTDGGRLIVDTADGEWLALSYSPTGSVYSRSSLGNGTVEIGTSAYAAAGSALLPLEVFEIPPGHLPPGFTSANVESMMDAVDDGVAFFSFGTHGSRPGYGPGHSANPGGGDNSGDSGGSGGAEEPAPPAFADNGALGFDSASNPFGVQATSATFAGTTLDVAHAAGSALINPDTAPYADAAPFFGEVGGYRLRAAATTTLPITEVRAYVGGEIVDLAADSWSLIATRAAPGSYTVRGTGVANSAAATALLSRGTLQFKVEGGAWNTLHLDGLAAGGTQSGRLFWEADTETAQGAVVYADYVVHGFYGSSFRFLPGPNMTLPGQTATWASGRISDVTITLEDGTALPLQNTSPASSNGLLVNELRVPLRSSALSSNLGERMSQMYGATVTFRLDGVQYTIVVHDLATGH